MTAKERDLLGAQRSLNNGHRAEGQWGLWEVSADGSAFPSKVGSKVVIRAEEGQEEVTGGLRRGEGLSSSLVELVDLGLGDRGLPKITQPAGAAGSSLSAAGSLVCS